MLVHLRIADYAIIDRVELTFSAGMNAITGETGAGKSIIIGAASLVRGGRASAEVVRRGAEEAVIEALFDVSSLPQIGKTLDELGLPNDGDELLVRRVLPRVGRGRIHVNGALCTASVLARVTHGLFDISGQHEHQSLSDRAVQRGIVDAVGVTASDLAAMREAYDRLTAVKDQLGQTRMDDQQRAERTDFLRFQLSELEAANLSRGEDSELEASQRRLARATDLRMATEEAEQRLYADSGSVSEIVSVLARRLGELQSADPALKPFVEQLDEARVLVEDAALGLGRYAQSVEVEPGLLEQVEDRLGLLQRLKRKHGGTVDELLARGEQMQVELQQLESLETRREELAAALEQARQQAQTQATKISRARTRAAKKLSQQISKQLDTLKMPGARFTVRVDPLVAREDDDPAVVVEVAGGQRRIGASGWDRVDFAAALNQGEDERSIGKVASGGELSRLMLAVQQVLGQHDPPATSIFDEVDAGISGAVADVVGRSLAQVSQHRQVILVTHLPQVAVHAHRHFHVGKSTGAKGRTTTSVQSLEDDRRVEALAHMLASSEVTEQARANAAALLKMARASSQ